MVLRSRFFTMALFGCLIPTHTTLYYFKPSYIPQCPRSPMLHVRGSLFQYTSSSSLPQVPVLYARGCFDSLDGSELKGSFQDNTSIRVTIWFWRR
ncbi:hypothetical protein EDC01DRAFT_662968 [Geopyxis carbonaria]|nr:hypothetical protein EDC01DRAFT_662968 [Geopyxis carbonaria]